LAGKRVSRDPRTHRQYRERGPECESSTLHVAIALQLFLIINCIVRPSRDDDVAVLSPVYPFISPLGFRFPLWKAVLGPPVTEIRLILTYRALNYRGPILYGNMQVIYQIVRRNNWYIH